MMRKKIIYKSCIFLWGVCFFSSLSAREQKIEAVIFDFGGVLSYFKNKQAVNYISDELNIAPCKIRQGIAEYKTKKTKIFSEEVFWEVLSEFLRIKVPVDFTKMFRSFLQERVNIHPEMKELVLLLKQKGYKVYMLSNQNFLQFSVLKAKGIFEFFDASIVSSQVRASKPDEKIYQIFLKQTKQDPGRCLFIDDKAQNLKAAEKLGFNVLYFDIHKISIESMKKRLFELL